MKTTKQLLALRLKELRKSRGLTQEKLAEMIGRDTKHISKLEIAGSYPSVETLERIANAVWFARKELHNKRIWKTFEIFWWKISKNAL